MKFLKKLKIKPLTSLRLLSLLGFFFFTSFLVLVTANYESIESYLKINYKIVLDNIFPYFLGFVGAQSLLFLLVTIQLFLSKPTSMKVLIPLILATFSAFILLVAIDFYIEFHLMHMTPRELLTRHEKTVDNKTEDLRLIKLEGNSTAGNRTKEEDPKKKGKGFKLGFLIIYIHMCVVAWFIYLAYKDLEEEIENQEYEDEPPVEITISHIT